jgi:hypothetical protein
MTDEELQGRLKRIEARLVRHDELFQALAEALTTWQVPGPARCLLCGNPSPRLDPAGVCAACRIGPVPPPEE